MCLVGARALPASAPSRTLPPLCGEELVSDANVDADESLLESIRSTPLSSSQSVQNWGLAIAGQLQPENEAAGNNAPLLQ